MPEREPQVPIIVQITDATKKYAEEGVKESDGFKKTVQKMALKMGDGENPQIKEAVTGYVEQGVSLATRIISYLPAFSKPEARPEILAQLKEAKQEGPWIDILANWNVNGDPYGIGVLRQSKAKDVEEIMAKAKDAENENQEAQIKLQAEAVGKGQDLIINYYRAQVESSGTKKAA